jgi:DivIVA domain-containing protein
MPLTPEDVQNKRFTVVRFKFGYDEEEVDNFLDEIEEELRRLLTENRSLREAATRAPGAPSPTAVLPPTGPQTRVAAAAPPPPPPAPPPPPPPAIPDPSVTGLGDVDDTALRTLMLAQRTAEDAINKAHQDAEEIVAGARAKATALEQELRAVHASRVADLEKERAGLVEEIAALRGFEREFRSRLRSYLESTISDLDARPSVAPAPVKPAGGAPAGESVQSVGRHSAPLPKPAEGQPTPPPQPPAAPPRPPAAPSPGQPQPPAPTPAPGPGPGPGQPPQPAPPSPAPPSPAPPAVPPVAPPASPQQPPANPFSSAPPPTGPPTQA